MELKSNHDQLLYTGRSGANVVRCLPFYKQGGPNGPRDWLRESYLFIENPSLESTKLRSLGDLPYGTKIRQRMGYGVDPIGEQHAELRLLMPPPRGKPFGMIVKLILFQVPALRAAFPSVHA